MRRRGGWLQMEAAFLQAALLLGAASTLRAQDEAERLRSAKALFFDRKYAEARQAWQAILSKGSGPEAEAAAYWIARSSENLGDYDRALREYGAYLDRRPADPTLAEEALTSRVGLAARLYKSGQRGHLPILRGALADPRKTVRYYAALQLSTLGTEAGQPAVPVLKRILEEETDEDLVDRAKLGLLRLDPSALSRAGPREASARGEGSARRAAGWIKVRIFERGSTKPQVSINLPVALAEMVFKSLPDEARRELRRKGYDADSFWERLRKLGPAEILTIEEADGERIQVWLE